MNNVNTKKNCLYVSELTNKINVKLSKGELILSAICQFNRRVTRDIDAPTRWDSSPMRLIMKEILSVQILKGKDGTASTASATRDTRTTLYGSTR